MCTTHSVCILIRSSALVSCISLLNSVMIIDDDFLFSLLFKYASWSVRVAKTEKWRLRRFYNMVLNRIIELVDMVATCGDIKCLCLIVRTSKNSQKSNHTWQTSCNRLMALKTKWRRCLRSNICDVFKYVNHKQTSFNVLPAGALNAASHSSAFCVHIGTQTTPTTT